MHGLIQPEPFMSKSPSSLPIEIKISTVVAISAILHSSDPIAIDAALTQMTGGVSDFFEDEFAVIDVAAIADSAYIDWRALDGIASIGITAGASAPEELVNEVIDAFRSRYDVTVEHVETATENVEFKVPRVLRQPA